MHLDRTRATSTCAAAAAAAALSATATAHAAGSAPYAAQQFGPKQVRAQQAWATST